MFRIYDGREYFYQWDLDRKLIVDDASIKEVHFCNRTDSCSLVCETYTENELNVVNVPNILLQTDWKIHVYAYDGKHTKHDECYEVKSRTKPSDYIYTETEVKNWEDVANTANEALAAVNGKEDVANKVTTGNMFADTFTDENYPSMAVFMNEISDVHNSMPQHLADLTDTSCYMEPVNYARNAINDAEENEIHTTYAKKNEMLSKGYKFLGGSSEVAETGISKIVVATPIWEDYDVSNTFTELIIAVRIPAMPTDDTTRASRRTLQVGLIEDENNVPDGFENGTGGLFVSQTANHGFYTGEYNTELIYNSYFLDNGSLIKTELTQSQYGTNAYPYTPWVATTGITRNRKELRGKKGVGIVFARGLDANLKEFPIGTFVEVYGR